jgi:hypothetical protein
VFTGETPFIFIGATFFTGATAFVITAGALATTGPSQWPPEAVGALLTLRYWATGGGPVLESPDAAPLT